MTDAAEHPPSEAESTDDFADAFLGALAALGGSAGNGRLRDILEWDEASYETVKAELQSRRLIVPGRGRGGSVALAGPVHHIVGADVDRYELLAFNQHLKRDAMAQVDGDRMQALQAAPQWMKSQ